MKVLAIESSCDETAVAIVEDGSKVLSSLIASQVAEHALFGGVVPEVAARAHLRVIQPLFTKALAEAGCTPAELDLIAVTQGPGLIGALLVGVSFAKGLAASLGKPLRPIDHVHAHVHGALLGLPAGTEIPALFPALALVVSGGHTNLYYMRSPVSFELVAATIDDACGECFDKVAKHLGLGYPGGVVIERLARAGQAARFSMPKMLAAKNKLMFSYSGLKTHVAQLYQQELAKNPAGLDPEQVADLCAAFQDEALGQLVRKLRLFFEQTQLPVKSLLVAGGVAANLRLRALLAEALPIPSYFPSLRYCGDNAAMIAALAWYEYQQQKADGRAEEPGVWDAYSRYRFELVTSASKGENRQW